MWSVEGKFILGAAPLNAIRNKVKVGCTKVVTATKQHMNRWNVLRSPYARSGKALFRASITNDHVRQCVSTQPLSFPQNWMAMSPLFGYKKATPIVLATPANIGDICINRFQWLKVLIVMFLHIIFGNVLVYVLYFQVCQCGKQISKRRDLSQIFKMF